MMTAIQDVQDSQGTMIRRLLKHHGPVTPAVYARAHVEFLRGRPGKPNPHQHSAVLRMGIYRGKWKALCPDCRSGITTGRLWTEARCFSCGAVFTSVEWPSEIDTIEQLVLKRPPVNQGWYPDETIEELKADNATLGIEDR